MVKKQHNNTLHLVIALLVTIFAPGISYAQSCSYLSKGNSMIPDRKCAPVNVDWTVFYISVNDGGTGNVKIQYDWDDGNPVELIDATYNSSTDTWTAVNNHIYPNTGDLCNYHPRATLVVAGVECTSSVQEQIVTVWDTDDRNGGELTIDPVVYPICVGNGATFHFTDVSQWNCTPPDENDIINDEDRWIQWIYGTGGSTITDAEVGGIVRTYPWTGSIEHINGPIEGPIAPYNTSEEITIPDYYPVGSFFEVTLRNWNVCNPYDADLDDGLPPADVENGDYAPVTTTARAVIVALPDASVSSVPDVCESEDPFYLVPATSGGLWSGNGITNASTGLFDPGVAGPGTHTIQYSLTDANGCSDAGEVVITVLGSPSATIDQGETANLCPGVTINIEGSAEGGLTPYTHSWIGDTNPLNNTGIADPEFNTTTVGEYEIIYHVEDANSCWDEDTIIIHVEDVSIEFTDNTLISCIGETKTLDPSPIGGSEDFVSHQWSGTRTDLLSATDIQNPTFSATETGTFEFTYTVVDSYGCTDSDIITITVYNKPTANAGDDINECDLQTTLNATPSIGDGLWKVVSGPGILTFQDFSLATSLITADTYGTYVLRWIEDNNSCSDSADISVTFAEMPEPTVMADKDTCGLSMTLIAYPDTDGGSWTAISGPGNTTFNDANASSTNVSVDTAGTYKFAWTENNSGCIGSDTVTIQFFQQPIASFTSPPEITCTPLEINFENNSQYADSYVWDFNNGTISNEENPTVIYYNNSSIPVEYKIQLIAQTSAGCKDTITATTSVAPSPISYFNIDNTVGCSPLISTFTNNSQGATSYEWNFGDGSDAVSTENPNHTFTNTESYTLSREINLTVTNSYGCSHTSTQQVTIYPKQEFELTASPDSACSPVSIDFIASPGAYTYQWDFGDGALTDGTYLYSKLYDNTTDDKEKHTVTVYTTSLYGCLDTTQTEVTILPSPTTYFEPNDFSVCSPKTVEFTNQTENISNSYWDFGDGTSASTSGNENITHTFTNTINSPLDYKIRLVTVNSFGCKDSMDGYTSVNPSVEASITGSGEGCSPLSLNFGNTSTGASSFEWIYGDGNSSAAYQGQNIFTNNTNEDITYDISMIATSVYGCKDTAYTSALVYATPVANFEVDPDSMLLPESTVTFDNLTSGTWNYEWNFGDNSTSTEEEPNTHTYTSEGDYNITLRAYSSYCENITDKSINIASNPPTVDYGPNAQGCVPLAVDFYCTTTNAESYLWDFGDGSTSTEETPSHTYNMSGEFNVTLTVTGPGGQTIKNDVIITVNPKPTSYFTINNKTGCSPLISTFTNSSQGATTYEWNFGDNSTIDNSENPEHTFINNETYTLSREVLLTVTNAYGCVDSSSQQVTIYPNQEFELSAKPDSACSPVDIDFIATTGGYSYKWDFGDGNLINGTYQYNKSFTNETNDKQKHTITLYTTSVYGCIDTTQTVVTIIPSPSTYFVPNDFTVCSPKLVEFTNSTENIDKSYWDFGDGTSATTTRNESIEHTYTNDTYLPLDYKIRLVTENAFGCKDSMDGYTSVNPQVHAAITGSGKGCSPLQLSFGNSSVGATSFEWDYGDDNTSSDYLGLNTFSNSTNQDVTYNVSMIATSAYGCSDTAYTSATVYATPEPDFEVTPDYLQMPESTVNLDNQTSGDIWSYDWNFGDETSSASAEPGTHTYNASGNYTISLRAYSSYCENTVEKSIEIVASLPTVEYGPSKEGCPALTVEFYSITTEAESYYWEFGDGSISAEANPTHTYYTSGEYNVTLTVTGPGGQTIKDDVVVTVYPQPTALFEAYPKVVTIPGESVTFVNQSMGATSYEWDFGNGDTSIEENPTYEYTEVGNYDVTLEAINDYGCINIYALNEPIIAEEGGQISFPNAFTPNPTGPASGEYTYGDKNNYVFYPAVQEGVEDYKLQIFTRWGQLIFESKDLKIGWNGYYNGKICAQGVYIWKATCRFSTGEVKVYTGDVTLIR